MASPTDYFRRWFRRWQCHVTVRLSQFESLDKSVGKIIWCHHAVAYFQTNCIPRRRNRRYIPMEIFRRYIPTVSSMGWGRRYIPADFEMKLFPSIIITDGMFLSIISLIFSGFFDSEHHIIKVDVTVRFQNKWSCGCLLTCGPMSLLLFCHMQECLLGPCQAQLVWQPQVPKWFEELLWNQCRGDGTPNLRNKTISCLYILMLFSMQGNTIKTYIFT